MKNKKQNFEFKSFQLFDVFEVFELFELFYEKKNKINVRKK